MEQDRSLQNRTDQPERRMREHGAYIPEDLAADREAFPHLQGASEEWLAWYRAVREAMSKR